MRSAKRLVAAWRVLVGVWAPKHWDLALPALTPYTVPRVPAESAWIDKPRSRSTTPRPPASPVPAEGLVLFYLEVHLELVRPLALLIWGAALALRSPAIRRGVAAAIADWKRTTDFGGASQIDLVDAAPGSKYVQDHAD